MSREDKVFISLPQDEPVKETANAYCFAGGLLLPMSRTTIKFEGGKVLGAEIPRWLADERGLKHTPTETPDDDSMSRYDWFLLGSTMAYLATDKLSYLDCVWEARKVADKLMKETQREEE